MSILVDEHEEHIAYGECEHQISVLKLENDGLVYICDISEYPTVENAILSCKKLRFGLCVHKDIPADRSVGKCLYSEEWVDKAIKSYSESEGYNDLSLSEYLDYMSGG